MNTLLFFFASHEESRTGGMGYAVVMEGLGWEGVGGHEEKLKVLLC